MPKKRDTTLKYVNAIKVDSDLQTCQNATRDMERNHQETKIYSFTYSKKGEDKDNAKFEKVIQGPSPKSHVSDQS